MKNYHVKPYTINYLYESLCEKKFTDYKLDDFSQNEQTETDAIDYIIEVAKCNPPSHFFNIHLLLVKRNKCDYFELKLLDDPSKVEFERIFNIIDFLCEKMEINKEDRYDVFSSASSEQLSQIKELGIDLKLKEERRALINKVWSHETYTIVREIK